MTFAGLALRSAFRNRLRTSLTAVGVAVAVVAFLFLRTIVGAFTSGVEAASQDRLVTRNKISFTVPLPLAYGQKIRGVDGVSDLSWSSWFGGVYKEPKNFFARFAIDAESYLRIYPELELGAAEKAAFLADRSGCIVGTRLVEKYGFKVGDVIHLVGDIYPGDWDFTVRGVYRGRERSTDTGVMFLHWKYLDERLPASRRNLAGIFVEKVADARRSPDVARAVDALFDSSSAETRTESERAFQLSFFSQMSAIVTALDVVAFVMLLILTLILGNTLAMSTRERTSEYAVMRAIGYGPKHVALLVLGEAAVVALCGFALGAALAEPVIRGFLRFGEQQFGGFLAGARLAPSSIALSGLAAVAGGILATLVPALRASRLRIVDALRQVE